MHRSSHAVGWTLAVSLLFAGCRSAPTAPPAAPVPTPDALERMLALAGEKDSDVLVVLRDGQVLAEKWYRGEPRRLRAWSITKSVSALAILHLIGDGRIRSLDEPLTTWFPQWTDTPKERITLRHVLTHSTGLSESWDGAGADLVAFAANAKLEAEPGTRFLYSNVAVNLLAGIVKTASGESLDRYVETHLFAPLGIRDFVWTADRAGNPDAMSGLWIAPAELARVGELMRRRGAWNGRQLLKPELVAEAIAPSAVEPWLGLLWWRAEEGFVASGMLGQHLVVLPEAGVVIVRMREGNPKQPDETVRFDLKDDLLRLGLELAGRGADARSDPAPSRGLASPARRAIATGGRAGGRSGPW